MKIVHLEQRLFELTEEEAKKLFQIPAAYTLVDAKVIDKGNRNILGLRFSVKGADVKHINLDHFTDQEGNA